MGIKNIRTFDEFRINEEFEEFEIVELKVEKPNLPVGTRGTIVFVHPEKDVFEVEFFVNGKNYVETLTKDEIE
jgi:hypothetical protein